MKNSDQLFQTGKILTRLTVMFLHCFRLSYDMKSPDDLTSLNFKLGLNPIQFKSNSSPKVNLQIIMAPNFENRG